MAAGKYKYMPGGTIQWSSLVHMFDCIFRSWGLISAEIVTIALRRQEFQMLWVDLRTTSVSGSMTSVINRRILILMPIVTVHMFVFFLYNFFQMTWERTEFVFFFGS
jgi:hypothetical protein